MGQQNAPECRNGRGGRINIHVPPHNIYIPPQALGSAQKPVKSAEVTGSRTPMAPPAMKPTPATARSFAVWSGATQLRSIALPVATSPTLGAPPLAATKGAATEGPRNKAKRRIRNALAGLRESHCATGAARVGVGIIADARVPMANAQFAVLRSVWVLYPQKVARLRLVEIGVLSRSRWW
mmetsp:Transcript_23017/g.48966  ORF Transcript_23017/g.48966 Transcript_23017/m.48966 type:complete len:181 (-) Transcript_23017:74-616(-)